MRKFLPLFIVIVIAILFVNLKSKQHTPATPTPTNPVTISAPNDAAIKGHTYTIKWTPGTGKTDIFLVNQALESEGVSVSLADRIYNVDNNGTYIYTVPTGIPDGEYRFQIGIHAGTYFTVKK